MPPSQNSPDTGPLFECVDCGSRVKGSVDNRLCSDCGGYLKNISVARAE